jgi:hypothetical protein
MLNYEGIMLFIQKSIPIPFLNIYILSIAIKLIKKLKIQYIKTAILLKKLFKKKKDTHFFFKLIEIYFSAKEMNYNKLLIVGRRKESKI